jgi:hypothetical protein
VDNSGKEVGRWSGWRRVNMVDIFCISVRK